MPFLNTDKVSQSDIFGAGWYRFQIVEFIKTLTGEGSAYPGRRMYKGQFKVIDGPEGIGRMHFENYVIGTPDDPDPEDEIPESYINADGKTVQNVGAQMLGRLFRYGLNLPPADLGELCEEAIDMVFDGQLTVSVQKKGAYAGKEQNNLRKYMPEGTQELGYTDRQRPKTQGRAAPPRERKPLRQAQTTERPKRRRPEPEPETEDDGTEPY